MSRQPDFLIIGDHKTGTTSMHESLAQHPDVFVPKEMKELRYFAYDADNPYHQTAKAFRVRDWQDYLAFFAGAEEAQACGEASPNYLRSPGTAARIAARLPQVKLIVCLRNPADRLYSLYQMESRQTKQPVSFEEYAFGKDSLRIRGNFYEPVLTDYLKHFSREQILFIHFADFKENSVREMQRIYHFIGVDANFTPGREIHNSGGKPRNAGLHRLLMRVRKWFRQLGYKPEALKQLGRAALARNSQSARLDPVIRQKILEVAAADTVATAAVTDLDLSSWQEYKKGVPVNH